MEGKSQIIAMLFSRLAKHMHDLTHGIYNTDDVLKYSMYLNQLPDHNIKRNIKDSNVNECS